MIIALLFLYGIIFGSFLNVVILRLPEGQTLGGRSACPRCGHVLSAWELVPVLSFLALGGKCRKCGKRISSQYIIIELVTGILFAWAAYFLPLGTMADALILAKFLIATSALIAIFMIDLRHFLILDSVLIVSGILVMAINILIDVIIPTAHVVYGVAVTALIAGLVGSLPFFLLWYFSRGKWMGFGDVKLMIVLGLILGWPQVAVATLLAFFIGTAFSIIPLALGKQHLTSKVPFGTFLSLSTLVCMYYGDPLLAWYLRFLGM